MTSDSDIDTWHYNATWHWQCHMSHTGMWHVVNGVSQSRLKMT